MKRLLVILFALMIFLQLFGCSAKDNIEEKAQEKLAEKILENAGGGKVDIDGDKVTFKGDDGQEVTVGGSKWPTSDLAKNIPEFTKADSYSVIDSTESVFISMESVKKKDFDEYLEKIKKDFAKESFEANSDGYLSYGGNNDKGISVMMQYSEETLTITVAKVNE